MLRNFFFFLTLLNDKGRDIINNIFYFSTLKKKVCFGKGAIISGNVNIGNNVIINSNVEISNTTEENSSIGNYSAINRNTVLRGKYKIGDNVAIGPNCSIMGFNHRFDDFHEPIAKQGRTIKGIIIENNVWIGANALILDGVIIGEGCVIGGGSVVTKSIPPFSIAVGNPCKVIKSRGKSS